MSLDPNVRRIYLDELRPPPGYVVDRAIGTTYSLDLLALLAVPLSMACFECRANDVLRDPIAVLEALRRSTGKVSLFSQQGRLQVPRQLSLLFSYLEAVVVEARPPDASGSFHPKIWLLRLASDDGPVLYRFICLSRNLTFDRSWDTVVVLEGELEDRQKGFSVNRPLAEFVKALPAMAVGAVPKEVRQSVKMLADEVRRVRFVPPDGFDEFQFIPSGIPGHRKPTKLDWHKRLLVVSPFLSADLVVDTLGRGEKNILISRRDSLDALGGDVFAEVEGLTEIYTMSEEAEYGEDAEPGAGDDKAITANASLSGLHAKLYVAESGWDASVISGSANATASAFRGRNVEFMVELGGKRSRIGIDETLGDPNERSSFWNLLTPYKMPSSPTPKNEDREQAEKVLGEARRGLLEKGVRGKVNEDKSGTFNVSIEAGAPVKFAREITSFRCYPITLRAERARDARPISAGEPVLFERISPEAVTSFFAFILEAKVKKEKAVSAFVLNVKTDGIPGDRDDSIMRATISNPDSFIRYLLFLLREGEDDDLSELEDGEDKKGGGDYRYVVPAGVPLLEELLRAYSRRSDRIIRIAKVIKKLTKDGRDNSVLPEDFELIWSAFVEAVKGV